MIAYIARRLGLSILMIALVSVLVFVVLRLLPGDPTITRVGAAQAIDAKTLAAMRHSLGLDDPILVQYGRWIAGLFHGDLGQSYFSEYPVGELIGQRIGATVLLAVAGLVLGVLLTVPLAVLPAISRRKIWGRLVGGYSTVGMAAPPFVFGIILIAVFSVGLGWTPTGGYQSLWSDPGASLRLLALPAVTLAITLSAPLVHYLRVSMREVESAAYVRTATGKGLGRPGVVGGHVLPNALLPTLTAFGVMIGSVLGGVVVVEYVFRWPGLGSLIVDAVLQRDYAVLQSAVLLVAAAFVLANLLIDILAGLLDPRLRVGGARTRARGTTAAALATGGAR
ncbi:MAG TPA: ABC transporter permease [Streptosporangiaceae bacterium]